MTNPTHPQTSRLERFLASDPVLERVRGAGVDQPVYLVGGAIRDALCDFPVDDIDLVVEGDPVPLVAALDPGAVVHERFGTAELRVDGRPVDIARARTERYPRPGALPEVEPGSIGADLGRRDFTINAIAIPLGGPDPGVGGMLDPYGGIRDLERGILRLLHRRSFEDDPTRALRAARYAARFGFDPAPETAALLDSVDFTTISRDRYLAELELISREPRAIEALRLLSAWGLVAIGEDRLTLAARAEALLSEPAWAGAAGRDAAILAACFRPLDPVLAALEDEPVSPSDGAERARRFEPLDLLLARAAGIAWLDRWREEWCLVKLEITGADLLAAGITQGPAVGAGMAAALRAKLDRGVSGPGPELEVAVEAARELA